LGYIVGLKYATIICAGSFLSWFVLVPLFYEIGHSLIVPLGATATKLIADMSAEEIFRSYVRHIGIGGIAMAGIIGVVRSSKIIRDAVSLAYREIFHAKKAENEAPLRTQTDIKMLFITMFLILTALLIFVFFAGGVVFNVGHAVVGLLIVLIVSFLFTTVAATAIAIVGTNPVSGMTLMTLILSSVVLVQIGLSGTSGMVGALIIGGVVCTALSVAGSFITDLKIGYWLGSTPKKQESWKFLGALVSAATVGVVIMILNATYGFTGPGALVAPQANAMAAVIQPLMSNVPAPWILYLVGAVVALLVMWLKISPLAFALGMYIPQELNTPLLAGGLVAWFVSSRTKNEKLNSARFQRGTLVASGFIAGGSLFGVIGAFLRFGGFDWFNAVWVETHYAEILAVFMFAILVTHIIWDSLRAKEE
jgi:putative OPT family oligopeptide transporter